MVICLRLFYFHFCVVLLTRGPSNWERGQMWWHRCARVFFYFFILFLFYRSFCCLCGSVERREHVFSWQDYASRIMQETCQGPKEVVITIDGVSISTTIDATIVRAWHADRSKDIKARKKQPRHRASSRHHTWQGTDINSQDSTGTA